LEQLRGFLFLEVFMPIDNSLLFYVLKAVCNEGKTKHISVSDFVLAANYKFVETVEGEEGCWYSQDEIDISIEMLLNDGFLFMKGGYIIPTVKGVGLCWAVEETGIDVYCCVPFHILEKQALAKCESSFFGA
jgi:hypothetical protein